MTPGPRIPWRKSLLVRLLLTSVTIAALSVGATAWLAMENTARAIQEEHGQVLSDDTDILRQISGYAATHAEWNGVRPMVRSLSRTMGRRIALTDETGHVIADSAGPGTELPVRASASVDPLTTDTYSEPGAQLAGIDPRAVGPYRLTATERSLVKALAEKRLLCVRKYDSEAGLRRIPSGRTVVVRDAGATSMPPDCQDKVLRMPVSTEQKALGELSVLAESCFEEGRAQVLTYMLENVPGWLPDGQVIRLGGGRQRQACVETARRTQLDPYVAPRARLYLGNLGGQPAGFDLSPGDKARIAGVAGLVLVVTVAMTTVVAVRLVQPLRALTAAALQPPQRHTRVVVTTQDETGHLAAAFNDLTARREQLEAQRKAMVSDIAHELRTPLTNIRGWLEVTRDGLLEPDPDLIASLHDEALLLQHVIDDLQDLAAADAGTLKLHRETVRTDELLAQVVSAHRARAEAAGIRLDTRAEPGLRLDADPVRIRQSLGNLISNALRHTPAGGTVTLTAHHSADLVVLTVRDTGSGIAPGDLPHVFDRFWRAEKSRSRHAGGSGLGLSVVRHFVEAHGGTVTADSEPGNGAVFTVRLPSAGHPDNGTP
ncbi:HAMP domain-containing sensor histidine kinase [Streptomyces sp. NPDC042207]|uniref:sensor histidine kinase n=1 Tax=Streptomyces sp. NPDC042207 TaxID=3154331 RepID=UPI0033C4DC51